MDLLIIIKWTIPWSITNAGPDPASNAPNVITLLINMLLNGGSTACGATNAAGVKIA